jgi:hypothetical protein
LGAAVTIDTEEIMGTAGKVCTEPGCKTKDWKSGKCWKHHPDNIAKKKAIPPPAPTAKEAAQMVIDHVDKAAKVQVKEKPATTDPRVTFECPHCQCVLSSEEVEGSHCPGCFELLHTQIDQPGVAPTFGRVINAEGAEVPFGVDSIIQQALREAMQARERIWLCKLSGLTPGKAIALAHQMVMAVDGLEY